MIRKIVVEGKTSKKFNLFIEIKLSKMKEIVYSISSDCCNVSKCLLLQIVNHWPQRPNNHICDSLYDQCSEQKCRGDRG